MLDPTPKSPERSAKRQAGLPWRLLALLIAMSGMSSLSLNLLVPAIPSMVAKFATEPANVQLTVSLYLMGLAFAQLVFGPLSDRFGRRPVVLAGLALAGLASTAAIFAANIASLITAPSAVLANLILEERAVPELLQETCTPHNIANALAPLLQEGAARSRQLSALARVPPRMRLAQGTPSEAAADVVLYYAEKGRGWPHPDLIGWR